MFELDSTQKAIAILVGLGTLGGLLLKLYKKASTKHLERRKLDSERAEKLDDLALTVERLVPMLRDIQKELQPNGGSSLRDTINEIRNEQAIEQQARRVMSMVASFEYKVSATQSRVLHVSPEFVRITGLTREDADHDGWLRAVADEDRERVAQGATRAMREQRVHVTVYNVRHVYTAIRARVEHVGTPVFNAEAEMVGWVGVLRVIEARMHNEQATDLRKQ